MDLGFTPLAKGTKIASVGTGYRAEIVSSEVRPSRCFRGRQVRKSVIQWTETNLLAGIRAGDEEVWAHIEGRFPRFIVTADQ
ncbi:hypothetical protein [Streptomyces sp. NPDC047070]|uniref:hypothetical protein n=1 Tax=Streptomyces sp. NPDC047070 TaxID=3154923 RepID=UPI003451891C